jgi:hypothetical protein
MVSHSTTPPSHHACASTQTAATGVDSSAEWQSGRAHGLSIDNNGEPIETTADSIIEAMGDGMGSWKSEAGYQKIALRKPGSALLSELRREEFEEGKEGIRL